MNEPTTPEELAAILKREFEAADDYHEQIEPLQEAAFRYYEAQPFGNEVEGRSQIVLPDVQETVDAGLAVILKTFLTSGQIAEFEAVREEDEQSIDDATAAINFKFMREQDGYRVIHDFVLDALQRKIGILKTACYEEEKVSRQWGEVQDELQLGLLPDDVEVEAVREGQNGLRVLIKTQRTIKKYTIEAVPPKEYRHTPNAKHEDSADYQAHVRPITRSDLVGMGFDRDQVYNLPAHSMSLSEQLESNKLDNFNREESTSALEEVLLCEEYAHIDVDGDGIAELVKCFRVENEILRWQGDEPATDEEGLPVIDEETGEPVMAEGDLAIETVDENPFAVASPFPRQHRIIGYSLADKEMDLQLARSFVARQLFDGMQAANNPRHQIDMTQAADETLDDYLTPVPGAPIRTRGNALTPLYNNFDPGKSLAIMEWLSREGEGRTGLGRASATLDENSLNPQTATEYAGRQSVSETRQEYMARNLVEAIRRAFGKLYRLMRVEAEPFPIKTDGQYRMVDPSTWPEDMLVKVNVGLGNGSKDKRIMARQMLLQPLMAAIEQGMSSHEHAFKWFDGMARDTDIGQGEDFIFNPDDPEVQQRMAEKAQQPDPEVQAKMAEMQAKQQEAEARLQLDAQMAQAQAQLDREKAQAAIQTEREKHAMQMQAARERAALEMELAREKTYAEIELAREKTGAEMALRKQQVDNSNITDQKMGGSVAS